MRTNAGGYVGWVRRDRRGFWRPVVVAKTYDDCEAALADLPAEGVLEESVALPAGREPIGQVLRCTACEQEA
jgi:hypothetical protein